MLLFPLLVNPSPPLCWSLLDSDVLGAAGELRAGLGIQAEGSRL